MKFFGKDYAQPRQFDYSIAQLRQKIRRTAVGVTRPRGFVAGRAAA